jgi:hypothetical protein
LAGESDVLEEMERRSREEAEERRMRGKKERQSCGKGGGGCRGKEVRAAVARATVDVRNS